jgi:adenine C2-methylase RlmN of 23S rRNA A2503 and tRNA A37
VTSLPKNKLTPSEKVDMAISMTNTCVHFCASGIKDQNQNISEEELVEQIRERFMFAKRHRSRV